MVSFRPHIEQNIRYILRTSRLISVLTSSCTPSLLVDTNEPQGNQTTHPCCFASRLLSMKVSSEKLLRRLPRGTSTTITIYHSEEEDMNTIRIHGCWQQWQTSGQVNPYDKRLKVFHYHFYVTEWSDSAQIRRRETALDLNQEKLLLSRVNLKDSLRFSYPKPQIRWIFGESIDRAVHQLIDMIGCWYESLLFFKLQCTMTEITMPVAVCTTLELNLNLQILRFFMVWCTVISPEYCSRH